MGRAALPGEVGVYHAHLDVWRDFLAGDADVALVMEDDVVFHPEFRRRWRRRCAARDRWDLLKLNRIRAKQPIRQERVGDWVLNAYLGPATGTGAYLITRDLAARLLPAMLPITRPIDHELDRIHVHDFRHFGLEPWPSHVDDGNESTITGTGFSAVKKAPWYRRLPMYGVRWGNLFGKAAHLARRGPAVSPEGLRARVSDGRRATVRCPVVRHPAHLPVAEMRGPVPEAVAGAQQVDRARLAVEGHDLCIRRRRLRRAEQVQCRWAGAGGA